MVNYVLALRMGLCLVITDLPISNHQSFVGLPSESKFEDWIVETEKK